MSGTFTSTIASNLFLDLSWSVLSQDIANNRSRVRLELKLRHTGTGVYFSASKRGVLQGSSFTYGGGFSGSGTRTLQTRDIWINHNSNGSKTQNISGSFDIAITYSGGYRGNTSVSGNITLPTIPRASSLDSFSIGSTLKPSTANSVSLSISRASGNFTHDIQLRDGTTVIASWNGQGLPTSLNLTASQVNTLLGRMSNVTSKLLTLRVQTKNGSTNIGSAVSRNATANVDSSVTPNINSTSASVLGQGGSRYVQTISGLRAEFTSSATGGATVTSRSITFDGVTGGSVVGSVFRRDFNRVNNAGTRTITYSVTDSRGRTTTATRTISVTAYSPPEITRFEASRNSSTPTTVNITRAGQHSNLSGSNTLVISIQKRQGTGSWVDVVTPINHTGGPFSSNAITSTGNNVALSYEFRMTLTDSFGNSATRTLVVSTQRVVLDVHKNEGVGIGKIHEQGVLDVDGDIFANGRLNIVPYVAGGIKSDPIRIFSRDANGHGYIEYWGSDNRRKGYVGFPTANQNYFEVANEQQNTAVRLEGNQLAIMNATLRVNGSEAVDSGQNSNGRWVRYYDGTQICYIENVDVNGFVSASVLTKRWTFPIAFLPDNGQLNGRPVAIVTKNEYTGAQALRGSSEGSLVTQSGAHADIYVMSGTGGFSSGWGQGVRVIAIGRWK